jgi:hypothetical protein
MPRHTLSKKSAALRMAFDFSISNALFDFGNFRFFSGQFGVSGLARPKAQLLVTAQADISSSIDRSRKDATISLGCIGPGGAA